jgi:hypothetical protein
MMYRVCKNSRLPGSYSMGVVWKPLVSLSEMAIWESSDLRLLVTSSISRPNTYKSWGMVNCAPGYCSIICEVRSGGGEQETEREHVVEDVIYADFMTGRRCAFIHRLESLPR